MLHQNWFMNKRFEMFDEYFNRQSFFDTETKCIYVVSEECGQSGSTIIQEVMPSSIDYRLNFEKYKEYRREKYWKKTEDGEPYYVSPNTGWVYCFYKLSSFSEKYPNTDMICCMCEYCNEQGILESGCESMEVMELIGWQFALDGIPYEDIEDMVSVYEEKKGL